MALQSVAVIALRQGRTYRCIGRVGSIALTHVAVLGRVWRTSVRHRQLPPYATYPFSCYGRSPDGMPSDRSRGIHSPAPLRVCLACIALLLDVEVDVVVVIGEVYT